MFLEKGGCNEKVTYIWNGLLQEALDVGPVVAELLLEDLDRYLLAQRDVLAEVDGSHAAIAEGSTTGLPSCG